MHELLHVGLARQLLGDPLEGLAGVELRLDEEAIRLLKRLHPLVGKPGALEPDGVDPVGLRVLEAVGPAERKHVLAAPRVGPEERESPHPTELVDRVERADLGVGE